MTKYKSTTVAIPYDVATRFRELSGVPLSLFVRATVNNALRLVEKEKKPLDDVLSQFMFSGL